MAKVKFKLSIKELSFEFEGDQGVGQAVSASVQRTLGSLVEAQNRVIDVTPREERLALPPAPTDAPPLKRRRHRAKPRVPMNGSLAVPSESTASDGDEVGTKMTRSRRPRGGSFRDQVYLLIREGYFARPWTCPEVQVEVADLSLGGSLPASLESSCRSVDRR